MNSFYVLSSISRFLKTEGSLSYSNQYYIRFNIQLNDREDNFRITKNKTISDIYDSVKNLYINVIFIMVLALFKTIFQRPKMKNLIAFKALFFNSCNLLMYFNF